MRRLLAVLVLAIAGIAIHAASGQAATLRPSYTITPGGSFSGPTTVLRLTRYELDVNSEWALGDTRDCEASLSGYATPGRSEAADSAIRFDSGSTWNCTSPADFDFSNGDWRLYLSEGGGMGWLADMGFTLDVGGRTCVYSTTGTRVRYKAWIEFGPFPGPPLDTPFTFRHEGVDNYIPSVPFTAGCGAVKPRHIWSVFSLSPGFTITYNPYA